MQFDIKTHIAGLFRGALAEVAPEAADTPILLERPKQTDHGDLACNVAMQLAKKLRTSPRQLAERLAVALRSQAAFGEGYIGAVEIAGAGFINLRLSAKTKQAVVARILAEGASYGRAPATGKRVQIEFVSANPTGPLHVGHGRGAAYGASVASLLAFSGEQVEREFYINDAGRQMDILSASVWLRYMEAKGETVGFPQDGYRADYVRAIADEIAKVHGDRFKRSAREITAAAPDDDPDAALDALIARTKSSLGSDWRELHRFAFEEMLADQQSEQGEFGVEYDRWFSEQSLFDGGAVERSIEALG